MNNRKDNLSKSGRIVGEQYIKSLYARGRATGGDTSIIHKGPEYFEKKRANFTAVENCVFNKYIEIAQCFSCGANAANDFAEQFIRAYFSLLASSLTDFIKNLKPLGVKIPGYIPLSRIPDVSGLDFKEFYEDNILAPLEQYGVMRAELELISDAFAPEDIRLEDGIYPPVDIQSMLDDLNALIAGSPLFEACRSWYEPLYLEPLLVPEEVKAIFRKEMTSLDLVRGDYDFNFIHLGNRILKEVNALRGSDEK